MTVLVATVVATFALCSLIDPANALTRTGSDSAEAATTSAAKRGKKPVPQQYQPQQQPKSKVR